MEKKIYDFLEKSYFTVTNINLSGNTNLTVDIIKKLEKLKGKNIFYIDTKKLELFFNNDIRVEKIKIKKEIPDTIDIEIKERTPYIYINYNKKILIADKNCKIYANYNEYQNFDFIILTISDLKLLRNGYNILELLPQNLKNIVSEIIINEKEPEIILKDGTIFKIDKDVDREKYLIGLKLYKKLKLDGKNIKYIDLRFSDYIVM
ncbi:cell division protein FtsQ [Haliovirga abyssi]|uniref:Cell division protein FtsQ n=2 Tax=Haliovirga abyssi TaxID=2996794 RepID=A0AAU9DII9_9FUSO|nr:cell division protein FtsQ [Haliovirga abyssi]